jgi:hypothetical protein
MGLPPVSRILGFTVEALVQRLIGLVQMVFHSLRVQRYVFRLLSSSNSSIRRLNEYEKSNDKWNFGTGWGLPR